MYEGIETAQPLEKLIEGITYLMAGVECHLGVCFKTEDGPISIPGDRIHKAKFHMSFGYEEEGNAQCESEVADLKLPSEGNEE